MSGSPLDYGVKDSGKRVKFNAGAVREDSSGKGRYDLISPIMMRRVAIVMEKGAKKYAPRNWERGIRVGRHLEGAIRHSYEHLEGLRDEDHLGHAICCLMMAIHTEEMIERGVLPRELNDLPSYGKETKCST